ncbi:MAG: DMT family transporter, partial [Chloroflexota bacterium]|nr:DMT family transporter [Chloroflexota bacterium]
LARGAALSFGLFFVFLDQGSAVPGAAPLWTVAGARVSSLALLLALIAVGPRAAPWPRGRVAPIAAIGVLDTIANALFAYASTQGNLGIVAVLGSLYPVATVILGRIVLAERLTPVQGAGVTLALAGVALLSAG